MTGLPSPLVEGTARGVDIAFTPVGRQGRAVSPCRRNVYVFTVNRTAVRRVETAGRIAFGVNLEVFNSDDCIFSRRKEALAPSASEVTVESVRDAVLFETRRTAF